jgi:hypothetical protein
MGICTMAMKTGVLAKPKANKRLFSSNATADAVWRIESRTLAALVKHGDAAKVKDLFRAYPLSAFADPYWHDNAKCLLNYMKIGKTFDETLFKKYIIDVGVDRYPFEIALRLPIIQNIRFYSAQLNHDFMGRRVFQQHRWVAESVDGNPGMQQSNGNINYPLQAVPTQSRGLGK